MINAPVLHVNGDYPEGILASLSQAIRSHVRFVVLDVVRAMEVAFKYRQYFRKVSSLLYCRWLDCDVLCL